MFMYLTSLASIFPCRLLLESYLITAGTLISQHACNAQKASDAESIHYPGIGNSQSLCHDNALNAAGTLHTPDILNT